MIPDLQQRMAEMEKRLERSEAAGGSKRGAEMEERLHEAIGKVL